MHTIVNRRRPKGRFLSKRTLSGLVLVAMFCVVAIAASSAPTQSDKNQKGDESGVLETQDLISTGAAHLLQKQEGENNSEWPYEGVYRVNGEIPMGYRIGGTAICAAAILHAPGYSDDPERQKAVHRAASFIIEQSKHPLMNPEYGGGYDVRGWGYAYGLWFLLTMEKLKLTPEELRGEARETAEFYIRAIEQIEIPECGGWNYARRDINAVSPPSPFMTAPTLLALFEAKAQGFEVDAAVVERGLKSLELARTPTGSFCYSGVNGPKSNESVPGSVGRMLAAEMALNLAGRSDITRLRGALDAFIVHWEWLEKRRCQQGTHVPPYGIAPYYFLYAHYQAAQAIELLPKHERAEYRRKVNQLLLSVRSPDGSWNDRVFDRSSNYGTAMAMLSLMAPQITLPPRWDAAPVAKGN